MIHETASRGVLPFSFGTDWQLSSLLNPSGVTDAPRLKKQHLSNDQRA